ncbi:glycosyltransferase family 39 protein [Paludibaculum fermentans]|uniref:Glycosyltransferase family 39 protein n=1 Tax=Paludibaculum fermentans TaxID=1473598 RepID=A0A7S7NPJ3_PALFE|nr:glycosyltransferase family 39 protein [Paludibaculum fermentans]QOY87364.1 glycosyltransferase family 39 protein [Paludibaculum fermentans]
MNPTLTTGAFGLRVPRGFFTRLWLLVALLAALVNAGSMVSIDPVRRLQQTRALWTSEPEIRPEEANLFGTLAYDGKRHAYFGLGQPLVFLPFDIAVTTTLDPARRHVPVSSQVLDALRLILIAFFSQTLVCGLAACFAYLLLRQLKFAHAPAALGTLSLLLATTFLHYIQNCQENSLMLAMALAGGFFTLRWFDHRQWRDAVWAGAAFGFSFLTRLTTLADAAGIVLCLLLLLLWDTRNMKTTAAALLAYAKAFTPAFAVFLLIERLYQYHRFWTFRGTYYTPFLEPPPSTDSSGNMFNNPLLAGVKEALWTPQNSIFLFDPLLVITLLALGVLWRQLEPRVRAFALGAAATLTVYIYFYATYMSPTGEISWGDRYTETPVLLLCLLAVPLLWTSRHRISTAWRGLAIAVISWSVILQIASILLIPSIEVLQWRRLNLPWSIPRRFINIWLAISGQGPSIPYHGPLPPEWQQLSLLPFQLGLRFGALQPYAVGAWCVLLIIALVLLGQIVHQCLREDRAWATH